MRLMLLARNRVVDARDDGDGHLDLHVVAGTGKGHLDLEVVLNFS